MILSSNDSRDVYVHVSTFLQERFYFGDDVLPLFETGIPLLKQRLQQLPESEKVDRFPAKHVYPRFLRDEDLPYLIWLFVQ